MVSSLGFRASGSSTCIGRRGEGANEGAYDWHTVCERGEGCASLEPTKSCHHDTTGGAGDSILGEKCFIPHPTIWRIEGRCIGLVDRLCVGGRSGINFPFLSRRQGVREFGGESGRCRVEGWAIRRSVARGCPQPCCHGIKAAPHLTEWYQRPSRPNHG